MMQEQKAHLLDISAVYPYRSAGRIKHSEEKAHERRLAASTSANHSTTCAGRNPQIEALQNVCDLWAPIKLSEEGVGGHDICLLQHERVKPCKGLSFPVQNALIVDRR